MTDRVLLVYPEPYFRSGGGIATYLKHAVHAHLAAGRKVHLLTWTTGENRWSEARPDQTRYDPLRVSDVTEVHFGEDEISRVNPDGVRAKNVSDLLFPHIARIEAAFGPDIIEGSDYLVPLHSYLERRRCGLHASKAVTCTFNHGLHMDIWPASAIFPSDTTLREFALESQVLQWSDFVLAPSWAAYNRLKPLVGREERLRLVREPFEGQWRIADQFPNDRFVYFGRVSFAKGVDTFAGLLSCAEEQWPISSVTFIGRREWMPFRRSDAKDYLLSRLGEGIRNRVEFREQMDRAELLNQLGRYGYFGNFSRTETFSYTTVEALAAGVVPLMLSDTAMSEFVPDDFRRQAIFKEAPFRAPNVLAVLDGWKRHYSEWMTATQAYVAELLSYANFNEAYAAIKPQVVRSVTIPSRRYDGGDVTVLIATHNDAKLAEGAIDSIRSQTQQVKEILVLDDGTSSEADIKLLERLADEKIIRLMRVPNMGLVSARNVLVENAGTDLVVFLDADDRLADRYVEKTLLALNSAPVFFAAAITRRKNFGLNENEMGQCLLGTDVHWVLNDLRMTALIKREVLADLQFDPAIRNGEADDWWWWLRFTLNDHHAVFVPEPLFLYRTEQGTMSWPWSEGQAVLTVELLKRAITEASRLGVDISNAHKLSIMGMYRNALELDMMSVGSMRGRLAAKKFNKNAATADYVVSKLVLMFGEETGLKLARSARALAYSTPGVRRASKTALSVVGKILGRRV